MSRYERAGCISSTSPQCTMKESNFLHSLIGREHDLRANSACRSEPRNRTEHSDLVGVQCCLERSPWRQSPVRLPVVRSPKGADSTSFTVETRTSAGGRPKVPHGVRLLAIPGDPPETSVGMTGLAPATSRIRTAPSASDLHPDVSLQRRVSHPRGRAYEARRDLVIAAVAGRLGIEPSQHGFGVRLGSNPTSRSTPATSCTWSRTFVASGSTVVGGVMATE